MAARYRCRGESYGKRIGVPLGLSLHETARAIIEVANAKMVRSIRMTSVECGHDPRDFVLVAFGGAGPLYANVLLRALGLSKVIVPYYPGLTSALGCIMADARHDFLQTINRRVDALDMGGMQRIFHDHLVAGQALLQEEETHLERIESLFQADMAYDGLIHAVRTLLPGATLSCTNLWRCGSGTWAVHHIYIQRRWLRWLSG